jgi:hypothetical protein
LQELYADQWAARIYGVDTLARALRHVIAARARFEAHAHATLDEVVSARRGLANLYTYRTSTPPDERRIEAVIERAWHEGGDDASSSPSVRVARVSSVELPVVARSSSADHRPAWALFSSREALETSMTDALRDDLARAGISIDAADELEGSIERRPAALAE